MSGVPHGLPLMLVAGGLAGLAVLVAPWPRPRRRLVRRRQPRCAPEQATAVTVPVLLDLVRAALDAGLPTGAAVEAALAVAPTAVDERRRRALVASAAAAATGPPVGGPASDVTLGPQLQPLARCLALAGRTGASVGVLLLRAASDERAARRRRASVAAGRLGVQLVLPLGLMTLPAFVLLGVVPVVVGLASDVLGGG